MACRFIPALYLTPFFPLARRRAFGGSTQGIDSLTFNQSSIIALAPGPQGNLKVA